VYIHRTYFNDDFLPAQINLKLLFSLHSLMRVLLYGSRGWIGTQYANYLAQEHPDITVIAATARAGTLVDVERELDEVKPDRVICFVGRTHGTIEGIEYPTIDYLEQPGKLSENVRDNLLAPLSLAMLCRDRGVHMTYLGTGCIFTYETLAAGDSHAGFSPSDTPNFTGSSYSTVKGATDVLMHLLEGTVLNLRIRMPIVGYDCARNFITKIKTYSKVCSMANSMTVLPDFYPLITSKIRNGETGTMNMTNPGSITHNEILRMYKDLVDKDFTWSNFTVEEQSAILASGRSNTVLDSSEAEAAGIPPIRDSLHQLFLSYRVDESFQRPNIDGLPDLPSTVMLVTGGAGFIGSTFINHIFSVTKRMRIINFDALYYCADHKNVLDEVRSSSRYTFVNGNLQSFELVKHMLRSHGVTHIVHFAAQSHVQNSFDNARQYTMDNVVGTHNLLEAARTDCPTLARFVHVSTDEVYGESMFGSDEKTKDEQSVLCPTNPYAASKAAAELIAQSYAHSFKMPIIITRGNNVYGPHQYPEKLIPRFIAQLTAGEKVTVQGDGSCVRAFLHSSDVAVAFECILRKGTIGEIYNIGCDEEGMEHSVIDVANRLIALIHPGADPNEWISFVEDRPFNDKRYYISNKKLKDLGWDITVDFDEGLRGLIDDKPCLSLSLKQRDQLRRYSESLA